MIEPKSKTMSSLAIGAFCAAILCLSACQKSEGPVERAGKEVDKTIEKAGQQIEKAGEKVRDATKQ